MSQITSGIQAIYPDAATGRYRHRVRLGNTLVHLPTTSMIDIHGTDGLGAGHDQLN